ncbi:MAG: GNAT family N-acetyltransferase [Methylocella sp.]
MKAGDYVAIEHLRDGRSLQIRALRPTDRAALLAAFERTSDESRYRRFFAPKRGFSEREIEFYLDVDFVGHVALAALLEDGERQVIAGGGRYIVSEPGHAEIAFAVDDPHQNRGIATRLMRHLVSIAREAGIREFVAEVLPDNGPMLKLFERCGLAMTTRRETGVVHVTLELASPEGAGELRR